MADAHDALRRLREAAADGRLDALADAHGVALLGAFGSATDASVEDPRDLDLAVAWRRETAGDYLGLLEALSALTGSDQLDLMDLDRATPVARSHGLVGVPLYEHVDGAFAAAQLAAIMVRMDSDWLRRLELELLAS